VKLFHQNAQYLIEVILFQNLNVFTFVLSNALLNALLHISITDSGNFNSHDNVHISVNALPHIFVIAAQLKFIQVNLLS